MYLNMFLLSISIHMHNDEKLLKHQLKDTRKAQYEMGNFCEQHGLPPIAPSRQKGKKHDKNHKKYKKYRNNFVKPNDIYLKKKNVSKKYVQQRSGKGKCFNCGKSGHFSRDCKVKLGNLKNKLNIDDSFDTKIGSRDSCCNVIKTNILTKSKEDKTLEKFNKKKSKELTVNDLQHEINIVKQEISELKHDFKNIKSDNNNFKQGYEHKDGDESSQQALLSDKGILDAFTNSQLALVNKIIPPKWFTKVKIVVSLYYHFTIIAMIDLSADMNCIQEGLIPSKYFEKSTERLVSANGSQMKFKCELNNAHVCHANVCFKIPSVLVKI